MIRVGRRVGSHKYRFKSFRLPTVRLEVGRDKSLRNTYCVLTYANILDYKSTAGDDLDDVDTTKLVRMDPWLIGSITESFINFSKLASAVGSEGKRSTRDNA